MIASLALAAALWPANVVQTCQPADNIVMVGVAQSTDGKLLYCEMIARPAEQQLAIEYTRNKTLIATKKLFYAKNLKVPDVQQVDLRTGEIREAKLIDNQLTFQYQANQHKKKSTAVIDASKVNVVDAGFDNFVREHWAQLIQGDTLHINFGSITHLKPLPLRIRNQALASCAADTNGHFCFIIEIDNALLRLVLGNIKLVYDQQHRLQKFDGIVNLTDDKEGNQKAVIHYYYQSDYLPTAKP